MRQLSALRASTGARLPLVLMNSFATRDDSLAALGAVPRTCRPTSSSRACRSCSPTRWSLFRGLRTRRWSGRRRGTATCIRLALSGMLAALLDARVTGTRSCPTRTTSARSCRRLCWRGSLPRRSRFCWKPAIAPRPIARAGTSPWRTADGALVLREVAQTPSGDLDGFQDITRHRFFNTNNLWLDLAALASLMESRGGVLGLPLIVNRKTVDPRDAASPAVVQLETRDGRGDRRLRRRPRRARRAPPLPAGEDDVGSAGAAIRRVRHGPRRLRRPRAGGTGAVVSVSTVQAACAFEAALPPSGPPSLRRRVPFVGVGRRVFGGGAVVRGSASVEGPARVPDGAVLEG